MATSDLLNEIPEVDIDESGIFKYVLIEVHGQKADDGSKTTKVVVRGWQRCEWHADIYKPFKRALEPKGIVTYCPGGGFIEHNPNLKKIKIYSESQAYGRADHSVARNILLKKYPDYEIYCDDD